MVLEYKNLTIDFQYEDARDDYETTGDTCMVLKRKDMLYMRNNGSYFFSSVCGYDEGVEEWLDGSDDTYELYQSDAQIIIFNWMFYAEDFFTFEYRADSPMWLAHDLAHAENDVHFAEVVAGGNQEEVAIFESMDTLKSWGIPTAMDIPTLRRFEREMLARWNYQLPMTALVARLNALTHNINLTT